jgi:hypothetical protein
MSKYGIFIFKAYKSEGLFCLSSYNVCFKSMKHVSHENEIDILQSRLYYINFGRKACLASMSSIPKVDLVKGSKCHVCVQSKQPCKPDKTVAVKIWHP